MGHLQIAIEGGELDWPDDKLRALQRFFWERCRAIDKNKVHFEKSLNSDMKKLAVLFPTISEQLMALTGAISMYLDVEDRSIQRFFNMVVNIYSRMKSSVDSFAGNRAYGAYKNKIHKSNLEATRNHFEYEDRRSGQ